MARFSENQMALFVHLYEMHYCLWKSDSPDYRNREKRESALQNIIDELKIPGFTKSDCKTKIKNIRSHYCQELKKIKASKKSGSSRNDIYKPTLPWFEAVDGFLRPVVMQKTVSNLQDTPREMVQDPDATYDEDETQEHEMPETPQIETINDTQDEASTSTTPTPSVMKKRGNYGDTNAEIQINKKTKRKNTSFENSDNAVISSNATQASKKTEFDVFGQSVAAQLNAMLLENALQLQLEIQQLITRKRISTLYSNNRSLSRQENFNGPNTAFDQHTPTGNVLRVRDHTQDSTDDSILSYFDL